MKNENRVCLIFEAAYEKHIEEKARLLSFVKQLAFLTEKARTKKDYERLKETAAVFSGAAEEMYASWCIPKRYLVSGNREVLDALKENELLPIEACIDSGNPLEPDAEYGSAPAGEGPDNEQLRETLEELLSLLNGITGDMETLMGQLDAEA